MSIIKYLFTLIILIFVFTIIGCGKKQKVEIDPNKVIYSDTVSVDTANVSKQDIIHPLWVSAILPDLR